MRISDMLNEIANWLESPNNEAILLAEYNNDCLEIVVKSCIEAATIMKLAAETVEVIEPPKESNLTAEAIEELAVTANLFDKSGNEQLMKQASVIDELLLTLAAPYGALDIYETLQNQRIEELKKKYKNSVKKLEDVNKIADAKKEIQDSPVIKEYRSLEAPLSTRVCLDHPGTPLIRVGEDVWQCPLDKKTYDFKSGFTLANGNKVPGGDTSNQTKGLSDNVTTIFDSREQRLGIK